MTRKVPGHLKLKPAVFARSRGLCDLCSRPLGSSWEAHHRQPRGMGGSKKADTVENLLALHRHCHRWVESNRAEAYESGFLVRSGYSPAEVPVHLHRKMWKLPKENSWGKSKGLDDV